MEWLTSFVVIFFRVPVVHIPTTRSEVASEAVLHIYEIDACVFETEIRSHYWAKSKAQPIADPFNIEKYAYIELWREP